MDTRHTGKEDGASLLDCGDNIPVRRYVNHIRLRSPSATPPAAWKVDGSDCPIASFPEQDTQRKE